MKLIGIIGEPASGKSRVVREILKQLNGPSCKFQSLHINKGRKVKVYGTHHINEDLYVLGFYKDNKDFPGTDGFDVGAIPCVKEWLKTLDPTSCVIFEGKLASRKFFTDVAHYDLRLFLLQCPDEKRASRHIERKDTQGKWWLDIRHTTINNMRKQFKPIELNNETESDIIANANRICEELT